MSQPTTYRRQFSFVNFSTQSPSLQQPGQKIDQELNAVKVTLDQILANLVLIQRDDGAIANVSVGIDQLKEEIDLGFNSVGDWATETVYYLRDAVWVDTVLYRCIVQHTAGATFAADLALVYWAEVLDITPGADSIQAIAALTPSADTFAYFTGATTAALTALTSTARSLLDDVSTSAMRTTLGLAIGTDVQAYDAELAALAGLTSAADALPYFTGSGTAAVTTLTTFGRSLIDDTTAGNALTTLGVSAFAQTILDDAAAVNVRATIGAVIGTDVQAFDAELAALAGLTSAADKLPYFTGAGTASVADFSAFGRSLVDDASASAARTTLEIPKTIGITIDGGGAAITTGVKGYLEIPFAMTITGWTLVADQSGSIVIDVWKDTYANFPPTVADTIAGTEKPTLSSAQKNQDTSLTTWTTSVAAGDIIGFNVDSAATVTKVTLVIKGQL